MPGGLGFQWLFRIEGIGAPYGSGFPLGWVV